LHKVPSWHSGGNIPDDPGGYPASQWQQKLKDHGWRIDVDNAWGAHSKSILSQFQADKGLTVDGLRGPASWTCLYCTSA
jgi:peptidoglycan hydrolase-like protein with peptidoglycan-binding domain